MSLIFKVSDEQTVPEWYMQKGADGEIFSKKDLKRIASLKPRLNEQDLEHEMDLLEKNAKNGETYYCSSAWGEEEKGILKELSIIACCKMKEVDPNDESLKQYFDLEKEEVVAQTRLASVACKKPDSSLFTLDKGFDEKSNDLAIKEGLLGLSYAKNGGNSIKTRGNTVSRAFSGTDDDSACLGVKKTKGKNLISDPNCIERSAKSKKEDFGERLRREAKEKDQKKKAMKRMEEKKMLNKMNSAGFGAKKSGNFRLLETSSVQGGVMNKSRNDLSKMSPGEKLVVDRKRKEKQVVAEKKKNNKQWDRLKSQSNSNISNELIGALKEELGKVLSK